MEIVEKAPRETFADTAWVSHIRLVAREVGSGRQHWQLSIRYTVEHVEVFKKPAELDALSSEVFGSLNGDLSLEEGKEYLLSGNYTNGRLDCVCGQVKPEEVHGAVAEWSEIPAAFIDDLRTFA